ncbi:MAG TPA: 8-amino-7-oxononanoate synthase [Nitrospirota bacterium]|nr:8-amino-7-oxononanoate synthase [Nitrospirota bacterium]
MFERELSDLRQRHMFRKPLVIESREGPRIIINGRSLLLMCSNDYLGLSFHPALREAATAALVRYGCGAGASRLICGTSEVHAELEERIARFKNTEKAVVYNSGYAANTGIISAIAGPGDIILSDNLNHASIIDGCRLSRAQVAVYRHRDMNHLEDLLRKATSIGRRLIVTDGVFSMDGDIAPLPELVSLSEKHNALLMVDDAHAVGVLGKTGKGTAEHFGLESRVPIQMGTLGKALGSFGAYAAGSRDFINFLINRSRSFIYSTALPPSVCAASIAAIDIVERESGLKKRVWKNRDRLVSGLSRLGVSYGSSESVIIPIVIGDTEKTLNAGNRLFECGIFASAIRPPTVAEGSARVRITVMATHCDDDIDIALDALDRCKTEGFFG